MKRSGEPYSFLIDDPFQTSVVRESSALGINVHAARTEGVFTPKISVDQRACYNLFIIQPTALLTKSTLVECISAKTPLCYRGLDIPD